MISFFQRCMTQEGKNRILFALTASHFLTKITLAFSMTIVTAFFVVFLLYATPAYCQKKGDSGTLQLIHRDGSRQQIDIATGVTIRRIKCDSLLISTGWYSDVSTIIINPCDTVTNTSVTLPSPQNSINLELAIYPNPTDGKVRIVINSTANEMVTLQVYSILGVLIYQFEPIKLSEAQTEINWDFKNTNGSTIATGIYFIHAVTAHSIVTHSFNFNN